MLSEPPLGGTSEKKDKQAFFMWERGESEAADGLRVGFNRCKMFHRKFQAFLNRDKLKQAETITLAYKSPGASGSFVLRKDAHPRAAILYIMKKLQSYVREITNGGRREIRPSFQSLWHQGSGEEKGFTINTKALIPIPCARLNVLMRPHRKNSGDYSYPPGGVMKQVRVVCNNEDNSAASFIGSKTNLSLGGIGGDFSAGGIRKRQIGKYSGRTRFVKGKK